MMTKEQERHLEDIKGQFKHEVDVKYRAGQEQHGGNLWAKGLTSLIGPEIRKEAIDLVVYTHDLDMGLHYVEGQILQAMEVMTEDHPARRCLVNALQMLQGTEKDKA